MKLRKSQRGFTLVEIVIVLAIGALILAGVLIAVLGAQQSRRDDQRKKDLTMLVAKLTPYQVAPANSAAITTAMFNAQDPRTGARYVLRDSGDPVIGEIQYFAGGECRTRPDGNYVIVTAPSGFAVRTRFESGAIFCLDSDNANNAVAAPAGAGGGGAAVATWAQNGSTMTSCSPLPTRCIVSGTKMTTYWSPVGFNYATSGVSSGQYTLTLDYQNFGTNPPANYAFNINVYVNGELVSANQTLPVNATGIAPGPYYINVDIPTNDPTIKVEWTNDLVVGSSDANFALNSMVLTK